MKRPERFSPDELTRIFNSAREEPTMSLALLRLQEAILARNGLLTLEETNELRQKVREAWRSSHATP
jgi:hypothetical protein